MGSNPITRSFLLERQTKSFSPKPSATARRMMFDSSPRAVADGSGLNDGN
ncbi:MAG: hypothetical protein IT426_05810 [Pirellulales bacterium]|nr:hypothetical protein [Pirellulales bacterium]